MSLGYSDLWLHHNLLKYSFTVGHLGHFQSFVSQMVTVSNPVQRCPCESIGNYLGGHCQVKKHTYICKFDYCQLPPIEVV